MNIIDILVNFLFIKVYIIYLSTTPIKLQSFHEDYRNDYLIYQINNFYNYTFSNKKIKIIFRWIIKNLKKMSINIL